MQGRIHSVESFGSSDGPGVRYVVFLQGCAMRCAYCHNPDTWDMNDGELMSADEILDRAERFRAYWGDEGGITASGGEPLLQVDFLIELFTKAKERGIDTCLDTALLPFTRKEPFFGKFQQLMDVTDGVLADLKHIDNDAHERLTGHGNERILDGFRYLSEIGKPVRFRHVLVPGVTDDEASLRRAGKFVGTLSNVRCIEVLPYHSLGTFKWQELGIPYTLADTLPPTQESVHFAQQLLSSSVVLADNKEI